VLIGDPQGGRRESTFQQFGAVWRRQAITIRREIPSAPAASH
jgi:hypothetical protein